MQATTRFLVIVIMIMAHLNGTLLSIWTDAILYLCLITISIIAVIAFWKNNLFIRYSVPEIILLLYITYLLVFNGIKGSLLNNERLLTYLSIILLYFPLSMLYKRDKKLLHYILYGILITTSLEIVIGFGQIFSLVPNFDSQFVLGGLFGNPGAFGGHLAIVFSFILLTVMQRENLRISENLYYTALICLFCIVFLIILSDSRGAWIATLSGLVIVLNNKFNLYAATINILKSKTSKFITGIMLVSFVGLLSFELYQYKPASAFGRLFVWKVSKEMILDKPLSGQGYGTFEANYGKTQAVYFSSNNNITSEIEVADYVTSAYNEFLEIFIESGLIGLILFVCVLYFAFVKSRNPNNSIFHVAAQASIISLFVLSMVSYPLKLMPNQVLFVSSLFVIFGTDNYSTYPFHHFGKSITVLLLSTFIGLSFFYGKYLYGSYHFRKGYDKVIRGDIDNALKDYSIAHTHLKNNGKFLFYYGAAFYLKHDYERSIDFLIKATTLSSNPNAFITLGNSLKELERYEEAEQAYKTASGITPAKLYPRYLLAQLYINMQEIEKALIMANYVLTAEEKISTTAGQQIKEEMQILIDQYSKLNVEPLKTKIMGP